MKNAKVLEAMREMSRAFGSEGGKTAARNMTPEERTARARKASEAARRKRTGAKERSKRMTYAEVLEMLEQAEGALEDLPEPKSDTEALVRVELANSLAQSLRYVRALAEDEAHKTTKGDE